MHYDNQAQSRLHAAERLTERIEKHAEDVAHDGLVVERLDAGPGTLDEPEDQLRQSQVFVGTRVIKDGQLVQFAALLNLQSPGKTNER